MFFRPGATSWNLWRRGELIKSSRSWREDQRERVKHGRRSLVLFQRKKSLMINFVAWGRWEEKEKEKGTRGHLKRIQKGVFLFSEIFSSDLHCLKKKTLSSIQSERRLDSVSFWFNIYLWAVAVVVLVYWLSWLHYECGHVGSNPNSFEVSIC